MDHWRGFQNTRVGRSSRRDGFCETVQLFATLNISLASHTRTNLFYNKCDFGFSCLAIPFQYKKLDPNSGLTKVLEKWPDTFLFYSRPILGVCPTYKSGQAFLSFSFLSYQPNWQFPQNQRTNINYLMNTHGLLFFPTTKETFYHKSHTYPTMDSIYLPKAWTKNQLDNLILVFVFLQ